jgi:hypothetical protein
MTLKGWHGHTDSYPGFLCFEGEQDDVQEMVRRIKALQWHAITVKTEETYTYLASSHSDTMDRIRQEAVQHCLLAKGHSAEVQGHSDKLRTTMDEVESGKELVERWVKV